MLALDRLRNPSGEEIAGFDVASVDLACAEGLPGSERLDMAACLAWLDRAADWVRHETEGTIDEYRRSPGTYDGSEGIFRIVALMNVLWRGLGVHYNQARMDSGEDFDDSRDEFIHGIIEGYGGTCSSLPVLVVSVGRRLGYPLKLVTTACHQFVRWDDPAGERFNVEINHTGLNTHPDEYYLTWPVDLRGTTWQTETKFLRSLSPREELARAWSKRGHILRANGHSREAIDCYATACSLASDDRLLHRFLLEQLQERCEFLGRQLPSALPPLMIPFPAGRRYPGLPIELERDVIALEVLEDILGEWDTNREQAVHCIQS